jgi:hypothetical protein
MGYLATFSLRNGNTETVVLESDCLKNAAADAHDIQESDFYLQERGFHLMKVETLESGRGKRPLD